MRLRKFGCGAVIAMASTFGLALALTPAVPVSGAQAATVYNFNKPQKAGKRVVRRRQKPQSNSPFFFFSPACLIPGGGSVVCAHQTLTKKKN